jgi:uncharacterized protein YidB (DUF937 family)
MGLFDQIAGQALGALGGGGGQNGQILGVITNLIGQHGGLQGLIQHFAANGLGAHAASWVGTGQNMPVSGDQISQALGSGKVQELAQQAGMSPDALSSGLASILPKVVDHLTPNGAVGSNDAIQGGLQKLMQGGLGSLLGR